jgi:enoyl-CoA hydratase/carnithine racemase
MSALVALTVTGGVADVRFDRADKHNSLTLEMFAAIVEAGTAVARDPRVRAVVLSGNGPSFCAGLDYSIMRAMLGGPEEARRVMARLLGRDDGPDNFAQRTACVWQQAPIPVIAAIRGVAYGGGCQIALGCDVRIAAPDARLSLMEIRYGLIPDMGLSQTLPHLVRPDVARDLVYTGRVVAAPEAQALGLVTRIADDPLADAHALAQTIARKSPEAIRAAKRLLQAAWRADARAGLALEEALQLTLLGTPNQVEAVTASLAGREPVFAPLPGDPDASSPR